MNKRLVTYFSASGVTARASEILAEAAEADIYEIKPKVPYSAADLNWMDKKSRSSVEMNDPDSRPAIAGSTAHIEKYDAIFLGFPIWWYTAPTIIKTFLESYDFTGKRIILFATSGGSGLGDIAKTLKKVCPEADIKNGKLLNGRQDRESLKKWADSMSI